MSFCAFVLRKESHHLAGVQGCAWDMLNRSSLLSLTQWSRGHPMKNAPKTSHKDEPFQREFQWEKPILNNLVNLYGLKVWCHEFILWIQVFSWKKSRMKHVIEVHWMNVHLKSNESNTFSEMLTQLFRSSAIGYRCVYIQYTYVLQIFPWAAISAVFKKMVCLLKIKVHRERHTIFTRCVFSTQQEQHSGKDGQMIHPFPGKH